MARKTVKKAVSRQRLETKDLAWMGSSRKDLVDLFPEPMRKLAGRDLRKIQYGQDPEDAEPMPRVGAGAFEVKFKDADGWYRIIYVAKFEKAVYVLHAFKKKTNATTDDDIDLAKDRYREAKREAGVR